MNPVEQAIADVLPDAFDRERLVSQVISANNLIPEGHRNDQLARLAGKLRRGGLSSEEIAAALQIRNTRACQPPLPAGEVEGIAASIGGYPTVVADAPRISSRTLKDLAATTFPERRPLLLRGDTPIFCAGYLGQVTALRGFGKSWYLDTLALVASSEAEALGFRSQKPCNTLVIDGEMAIVERKGRFDHLSRTLGIDPPENVRLISADDPDNDPLPKLDTPEGQDAIERDVEWADFILADNRSCLLDPESEKDPSAWTPMQEWLLSLRRRGKAVLIAHHSNRMGGARGHSRPEDVMNLLMSLTKPEDYSQDQGARFNVAFDKSRGAHGAGVAPFTAHLTADGWQWAPLGDTTQQTTADRLLDEVRLACAAGEYHKSANAAIGRSKVNRNAGLKAWRELLDRGAIVRRPEGGFFAR